jgi:hypothetical protein
MGESISSRSVIGIRLLNECLGRRFNDDGFERFVDPFVVVVVVKPFEYVGELDFPLGSL